SLYVALFYRLAPTEFPELLFLTTRQPLVDCHQVVRLPPRVWQAILWNVDGGGKRRQNSGGLVTFHSAPYPLGRGVLSDRPAAVKGAPVLRGEANPSRRGPF